MLRFISHLFKLNYEPCKGCEVLKNQLDIANHEKERLQETLLDLVKPKIHEVPSTAVEPIRPKIVPWHVKQRELQAQSAVEARLRKENVDKLERELGIKNEEDERKEKEGN